MSKKTRKIVYVAGFFAIIIGIFYAFAYTDVKNAAPPLPVLGNPGHKVGHFAFVDQQGDTVTQNNLNGKVTVVEYFFTRCTNLCPRMNKNMDKIYEDFKNTPNFQILANTVDPAHDSVPVLAKYAEQWGANPKVWKFLTGPRDELFNVAINQFLLSVADSEHVTDQFVHTQYFALVDQQRRIRGFYDGLKQDDLTKLRKDIRTLLKED
jgi:protein SCO1/2